MTWKNFMFGKNVIFFVCLVVIAANTVFSQSLSTEERADYKNCGLNLYGAADYENDYTTGDRILMGALNMLFGLGSTLNGHKASGTFIAVIDLFAVGFIIVGSQGNEITKTEDYYDLNTGRSYRGTRKEENTIEPSMRRDIRTAGILTLCGGIVLGYLFPFTYHKPEATRISQNDFPFNIEPALTNNGEINGLRVCYSFKY